MILSQNEDSRLLATIGTAFAMIGRGETSEAGELIQIEAPHQHHAISKRKMTDYEKLCIYLRDGFIDRYSGTQLLFPPILRIISSSLGTAFPFQKNWRMSECHIAYWKLVPTYDHIKPIAAGGKDIEENIVTTSQLKNSAKSNFELTDLGWRLHEPGLLEVWDGMIGEYRTHIGRNPDILRDPYVRSWDQALRRCTEEGRIQEGCGHLTSSSTPR